MVACGYHGLTRVGGCLSGMASENPVVIVGGGLAGASAAIEVLRHGGKVVLLEKTDR